MASKSPLKIIGIVIGVFVLLIVASVITLRIMFPPEKIKAMILPHIEKAVGRSVQVEGAGFSFFPVFGVKIKGLKVANTDREGFSEDPFLTLEEFLVKVKVMPLLQKRLDISAIILDKPNVLLEVDRMGSFNYEDLAFMKPKEDRALEKEEPEKKEAPKTGMPVLPIPLTMELFQIKQGRIVYHDMKAGRKIDVGEMNQRVDFSIDKELKDVKSTGKLVLSGVSVITGEISKPLTGFTITFSHDVGANVVEGEAVIKDVRLSLQKIYIGLSGTVKNFNAEPALDLNIKTEKISIADVLAEIPVELFPDIAKLKAKGFIQIAMILSGVIDATGVPHLKGTFTLGDGHIQYADLPEAISDIRADISFTKNSLIISDFGFNLGKNPVLIKANIVNFAQPDVDALVKATVNLDDLKNIIELPEGVSLSGVVKSDITAKGLVDPNDPMKMDIKGNIVVTNLRVKTPDIAKPVVVNGSTDFSPRQIANKMNIGIGSSDINISSKITDYLSLVIADSTKKHPRPMMNFNIVSLLLNTSDFLEKKTETVQKKTEPATTTTPAPAKGGPAPILAAPLPVMDMKGSISCRRFVYENIEMKNFNTQLNSVNDVMDVTTKAQMFSGIFSNKLNLDARNLDNVRITNKFNIDNIEVNDFVSSVNDLLSEDQALYKELKKLDDQIFGKLSLKTDITCNGATTSDVNKTLNGTINAKINNGKIKSNLFTQGINEKIKGFSNKIKIPIDNLLDYGDIDFSNMKLSALIKDEKVFLDDFDINSSKGGEFDVGGNVGFNGILDIVLANRLQRNVSQKILSVQDKVKGFTKGGLKQAEKELGKHIGSGLSKTLGKVAESQLDKRLITPDKDGRVTMVIGFGGTAAKPAPKSLSFKKHEVTEEKAEEKPTEKQELGEKLQNKVGETKKEVEEAVKKETEKVTKEVEKKVDEVIEKTVPKEAKKETEETKKKAMKKLKKLF